MARQEIYDSQYCRGGTLKYRPAVALGNVLVTSEKIFVLFTPIVPVATLWVETEELGF
jgi:hypothetical protein